MRTIRTIFGLAAVWVLGFGGSAYGEDLKTNDGRVYQQIKVMQVDPNGVFIRHSKGIAKVHFKELSTELQEKFGYDSGSAERFERDHEEGEPPALPAPPPGGFQRSNESQQARNHIGAVLASVQYNLLPNAQCGPIYNPHLEWRRRSLCDLLHSTYHRPINYVAPWQLGGYPYNIFRRR